MREIFKPLRNTFICNPMHYQNLTDRRLFQLNEQYAWIRECHVMADIMCPADTGYHRDGNGEMKAISIERIGKRRDPIEDPEEPWVQE